MVHTFGASFGSWINHGFTQIHKIHHPSPYYIHYSSLSHLNQSIKKCGNSKLGFFILLNYES
jgi:hypothetical protein